MASGFRRPAAGLAAFMLLALSAGEALPGQGKGKGKGRSYGHTRPVPEGAWSLDGPAVIRQPGSYVLTSSFQVRSGPAFEIESDDVTLDLNGHTIRHKGDDDVIVSAGGHTGISIVNGRILGGHCGVMMIGGPDGEGSEFHVSGLTVRGQSAVGISLWAPTTAPGRAVVTGNAADAVRSYLGAGISVAGFPGALVTGNSVRKSWTGLELSASPGSDVAGNDLTLNRDSGLRLNFSEALTVRLNEASGNRGYGAVLQDVFDSDLDGNLFNGNRGTGVLLATSAGNLLDRTVASRNGEQGLYLCCGSAENVIRSGVFVRNGQCGVLISENSTGNTFEDTLTDSNEGDDYCGEMTPETDSAKGGRGWYGRREDVAGGPPFHAIDPSRPGRPPDKADPPRKRRRS